MTSDLFPENQRGRWGGGGGGASVELYSVLAHMMPTHPTPEAMVAKTSIPILLAAPTSLRLSHRLLRRGILDLRWGQNVLFDCRNFHPKLLNFFNKGLVHLAILFQLLVTCFLNGIHRGGEL